MNDESSPLGALPGIIADVIEPNALAVDRDGAFPRAAVDALGKASSLFHPKFAHDLARL